MRLKNTMLADQLTTLSKRMPPKHTVKPVVQIVGSLDGKNSIENARNIALRWIQGKAGQVLPEKAWQGETFELDHIGAQPTEVIAHDDGETQYWCGRCDDADKTIPGRRWTTEIALVSHGAKAYAGMRLTCVSRGENVPFGPSVPSFIRDIGKSIGIVDGERRFNETPWRIQTDEDVDEFLSFLMSPQRKRQIIVLSLPGRESVLADAAIDGFKLAKSCFGVAHVVILPVKQSWRLTEVLGKELAVFNGAVRTYMPGFDNDRDADNPSAHPLALYDRIMSFQDGPQGFSDMLVTRAFRDSVRYETMFRELPEFSKIKQKSLEALVKRMQSDRPDDKEAGIDAFKGGLEEANRQIALMTKEQDDLYALLESEEADRFSAEKERDETKRELHDRDTRINYLEQALRDTGKKSALDVPIPQSLDNLDEWSRQYLTGKIMIHPRAIRGAKKSEFSDPALIYNSLLLLAHEYRDMRIGSGNRESYEKKLSSLRLKNESTHHGDRAGEEGDEYYVNICGRRYYLEDHLKFGASREPKHCMRIYYFWNQEDQQAVVGWLPSHLTTRQS